MLEIILSRLVVLPASCECVRGEDVRVRVGEEGGRERGVRGRG